MVMQSRLDASSSAEGVGPAPAAGPPALRGWCSSADGQLSTMDRLACSSRGEGRGPEAAVAAAAADAGGGGGGREEGSVDDLLLSEALTTRRGSTAGVVVLVAAGATLALATPSVGGLGAGRNDRQRTTHAGGRGNVAYSRREWPPSQDGSSEAGAGGGGGCGDDDAVAAASGGRAAGESVVDEPTADEAAARAVPFAAEEACCLEEGTRGGLDMAFRC